MPAYRGDRPRRPVRGAPCRSPASWSPGSAPGGSCGGAPRWPCRASIVQTSGADPLLPAPASAKSTALICAPTPLPTPDPLHPLVVHQPTRVAQQGRDLAVAVAAIPPRQLDDVGGEPLFVVAAPRPLALRRAVLAERRAGAALGHPHRVHDVLDAGAPARGARQFPRAASARICLSRVRSATALRSRAFSASSAFSRFTWSAFRPPNSRRQR